MCRKSQLNSGIKFICLYGIIQQLEENLSLLGLSSSEGGTMETKKKKVLPSNQNLYPAQTLRKSNRKQVGRRVHSNQVDSKSWQLTIHNIGQRLRQTYYTHITEGTSDISS